MRAKQIAVGSFAVLLVAGCNDKSPTISDPGLEYSSATHLFDPGATVGWQATARSLVAATPMSPMAAARIYAAVSVAQHKSVMAVDADHADEGGRSQFEAAAAATVLTHFFPTQGSALARIVADAGLSRIIGGIHYRFDIEAGQTIGTAAGQLALAAGF